MKFAHFFRGSAIASTKTFRTPYHIDESTSGFTATTMPLWGLMNVHGVLATVMSSFAACGMPHLSTTA